MFRTDLLWIGASSFALAWVAHALTWRVYPSHRTLSRLFILMLFVPTLAYFMSGDLLGWRDMVLPSLLHSLLAANYIAIYPAFEAVSPTIEIIHLLDQHREGLFREELVAKMSKEHLSGKRRQDLIRMGWLEQSELSPVAHVVASFFIFYRRFLGLPVKGG